MNKQEEIIEICEKLLDRAKSGEITGLMASYAIRNGQLNARYSFDTIEDAHRSISFSAITEAEKDDKGQSDE